MKLFVSFALLLSVFFSMSGFTTVNPPVHKKSAKKSPPWPITGTHSGFTYSIGGSANTPSGITFPVGNINYTYFFYQPIGTTQWECDIPTNSPVYGSIRIVKLGIFTNSNAYTLEFLPDF